MIGRASRLPVGKVLKAYRITDSVNYIWIVITEKGQIQMKSRNRNEPMVITSNDIPRFNTYELPISKSSLLPKKSKQPYWMKEIWDIVEDKTMSQVGL